MLTEEEEEEEEEEEKEEAKLISWHQLVYTRRGDKMKEEEEQ